MKLKYMIVFCLVAALVLTIPMGAMGAPAETQESETAAVGSEEAAMMSAEGKNKDEVIYATLASDGSAESIYAVNQFRVARAGTIVDYGNYESVVNLTDTRPITQEREAVTFAADAGNFYYQGNMASTDLPWIFDLTYYLDGSQTAPQDLAGRDGNLEIKISSTRNEKIDPTFYDNYMMQITVTLDAEKCRDINAPDATIADAGGNKAVVYTVLPGNDADFSLHATVGDFEMAGIDISAVPFSMDVEFPDTDEQFEDLDELPGAVSDLNDGVAELKSGTQQLKDGAHELTGGSAEIESGLNQLSGNSGELYDASAQINTALTGISASLSGGSLENIDLSQIAQLPQALSQLSDGLGSISGGFTDLKNGFVPAYAALDAAIAQIPAGAVSDAQMADMRGDVRPELQGAFDELVKNYAAAQTVKGTYANVKGAFDAVGGTIDTLNGSIGGIQTALDDMSTEVGAALEGMDGLDDLGELATGLNELATNYASFHAGLSSYVNGVNTLASNYSTFHAGVASFESGVGEFSDGIGELYEGTSEFKDETADIPDQIQEEIDKMKEEYLPADFDPVSFTSSQNTDTGYVQFVMKTGGIEKTETDEAAAESPGGQEETFWDRLTALFEN
jgi:X-X-X-Leu-X-X-Gly heptad repeat protein